VSSVSLPFDPSEYNGTVLAREGEDFRLDSRLVQLQPNQSEAVVVLIILDDTEPEGPEAFFVFLSDPQGAGVQIAEGPDQHGYGPFAKIIILGKKKIFQSQFPSFSQFMFPLLF